MVFSSVITMIVCMCVLVDLELRVGSLMHCAAGGAGNRTTAVLRCLLTLIHGNTVIIEHVLCGSIGLRTWIRKIIYS